MIGSNSKKITAGDIADESTGATMGAWSQAGSARPSLVVAALLLTAACGAAASPSAAGPSASLALAPEVEAAIRSDLETRVGVDASATGVVSIERQTWPDGAMGCPQPDEFYTQAIVEGYRVVISLTGGQYDYRVSDGGQIRFCGAV
jgi:hypothetical protein